MPLSLAEAHDYMYFGYNNNNGYGLFRPEKTVAESGYWRCRLRSLSCSSWTPVF